MRVSLKDRLVRPDARDLDQSAIVTDPPPWVARALASSLIVIFLAAVVAAIVVRVPETVQAPCVLVPESGADPVQAPLVAVVEQIRVTEGQEVPAGSELFVLRSDEIRAWQTQLRTLEEDLRAKQGTIDKLEASYASEIRIRQSLIEQDERDLELQRQQVATQKEIVQRLDAASRKGLSSVLEAMEHKIKLTEMEKSANHARKSLAQAVIERLRLETERDRRLMEERNEQQKFAVRIQALHGQLTNSEGALLSIRAPYHGIVISLNQRNPGSVVQSGQELCQLARVEGEPHARLLIDEQRLARIAPQQRVRLFFDAFPFQRYGTITGRLDWISPAAVVSATGQQFVGLASLDSTSITVDGRPHPLRVGMKGYARIVVGTRSIAEIAFEPLRELRELNRQ